MTTPIWRRVAHLIAVGTTLSSSTVANSTTVKTPPAFLSVSGDSASITVRDTAGRVVRKEPRTKSDAEILQWAIDTVGPGAVTIHAGRYVLDHPLLVTNSANIAGDGHATVLVPPTNDYAIRARLICGSKGDRWNIGGVAGDHVLMGISITDLTIDGTEAGRGKGIHLSRVGQSLLSNLTIVRTRAGAGLYIDGDPPLRCPEFEDIAKGVEEVTFSQIHMLGTGNAAAKEASIVVASQDSGDPSNNLHFDDVFVIFPNYIGMEVGAGSGKAPPRLLFITRSMFHGWLGKDISNTDAFLTPAPFALIRITRGLAISIRDSRLTNSGERASFIDLQGGDLALFGSVLGWGRSGTALKLGAGAYLLANENTFFPATNSDGGHGVVLDGQDAGGVTFSNNKLMENCGPIRLRAFRYAILKDNVFFKTTEDHALQISSQPGANLIMKDNVFLDQ